jgi:hypothetical protein
MNCFHCARAVEVKERVAFRDTCAGCDRALHACLNCEFYDPSYNNQCREPQAERVVDKDRPNFCEYFAPAHAARKAAGSAAASAGRANLEALFRKK